MPRRHGNRSEENAAPLDLVALTLALWLGVMVAVTGLVRLAESAAANARMAQLQRGAQPQAGLVVRPAALPYAAAYGG